MKKSQTNISSTILPNHHKRRKRGKVNYSLKFFSDYLFLPKKGKKMIFFQIIDYNIYLKEKIFILFIIQYYSHCNFQVSSHKNKFHNQLCLYIHVIKIAILLIINQRFSKHSNTLRLIGMLVFFLHLHIPSAACIL
jgi:hypothetical protein